MDKEEFKKKIKKKAKSDNANVILTIRLNEKQAKFLKDTFGERNTSKGIRTILNELMD